MRRITLAGAVICAAVVGALFATAAGVRAQSTPDSSLTVCSTGATINVDGKNFLPNFAIIVWFGGLFADFSAQTTTDSSGAFEVGFPPSALDFGGTDVVVSDTNGESPFSAPIPSPVPACPSVGGGAVATQVSLIGAAPPSPATHPAVQVTGQLRDATGAVVTTPGIVITFNASDGSTVTCPTDVTGSCPVFLPLSSRTETISANIPGGTGTLGGSLSVGALVAAASASAANSTVSASPTTIAADGASTSTVTVQARDQFGFDETSSAGTVSLTTSRGSLSTVTDNHNGTYTATLTSSTSFGAATISGQLNGSPLGNTTSVAFTQVVAPGLSTISASPNTIAADGTSTSTVSVQVKDLGGANFVGDAGTVTLSTTLGTFAGGCTSNCPAQFNGSGGYSAVLTSVVNGGTATITGAINNASVSQSATVTLTPVASAANSVISAPTATVPADGMTTATVTVQIKDLGGNNFTSGGGSVVLSTTLGTLSAVTDNGNGTYTATILSSTAGVATITAMFNGSAIPGSASVTFTPWVSPLGCPTALGDVHGGLDVKGGIKIGVEADCDPADKKHPTSYLHHAKLHVEGLGIKFDAKRDDDGKKGDITSVVLTRSGDGSATAVFNGTFNGQTFTLQVTDGGSKKGQDSFTFTYGGRVFGPYTTPHGNVKIDLR